MPDIPNREPQQPQRQDSLDDQLRDVIALANRAGCYDAADVIRRRFFPERRFRAATDDELDAR